jgi:hypothetical protein
MKRRILALAGSVVVLACTVTGAPAFAVSHSTEQPPPTSIPSGPSDPVTTRTNARDAVLGFFGTSSSGEVAHESKPSAVSATPPPEYRHGKICGVDTGGFDPGPDFNDGPCPRQDALAPPDCGQDDPVEPLWVRRPSATEPDGWGPWQLAAGWSCPADALPPFTQAELRRLTLPAPVLKMQPPSTRVLVNMETIAYAQAGERTFRTSLLGHPMTVVATPRLYAWDWGDGARSRTTSPGHAYPHEDVTHVYERLDRERITVTVIWTATYQYDGYPTVHDVNGTATTTARTGWFDVVERRGHLVAETCDQDPDAPGC